MMIMMALSPWAHLWLVQDIDDNIENICHNDESNDHLIDAVLGENCDGSFNEFFTNGLGLSIVSCGHYHHGIIKTPKRKASFLATWSSPSTILRYLPFIWQRCRSGHVHYFSHMLLVVMIIANALQLGSASAYMKCQGWTLHKRGTMNKLQYCKLEQVLDQCAPNGWRLFCQSTFMQWWRRSIQYSRRIYSNACSSLVLPFVFSKRKAFLPSLTSTPRITRLGWLYAILFSWLLFSTIAMTLSIGWKRSLPHVICKKRLCCILPQLLCNLSKWCWQSSSCKVSHHRLLGLHEGQGPLPCILKDSPEDLWWTSWGISMKVEGYLKWCNATSRQGTVALPCKSLWFVLHYIESRTKRKGKKRNLIVISGGAGMCSMLLYLFWTKPSSLCL